MKNSLVLLFLCILPLKNYSQNFMELLFGNDTKVDYIGQKNYNGKRKNGFGIERWKDGTLYVGDFQENSISGYGMLISPSKGISNVHGSVIYVGNLLKGKKEGIGVCYDVNGKVVYDGKFANDKPTELSLFHKNQDDKCFVTAQIGEELYMGETKHGVVEGFGLMVQKDGSIIFGMVKDGLRHGISMTFYSNDVWEVGQWTDGKYRVFNNSQIASARLQEYIAIKQEKRRAFWNGVEQFVSEFGMAMTTIRAQNEFARESVQISTNQTSQSTPSNNVTTRNNSTIRRERQTNCHHCHGSKKCSYCNGGGYNYPAGHKVICSVCAGSTICHFCHGTGIEQNPAFK